MSSRPDPIGISRPELNLEVKVSYIAETRGSLWLTAHFGVAAGAARRGGAGAPRLTSGRGAGSPRSGGRRRGS